MSQIDGWHRPNPILEPDSTKVQCIPCGRWCDPQTLHHCTARGKIVLVPA